MSNKFTNFAKEFQSMKKMNNKNYFNSYYKKAPGKENSENFMDDSELNINILEQNSNLKKNRIAYKGKQFNVREKTFMSKDHRKKFCLFREKEIKLNGWDNKVDILDSEEDYDSDDNIINQGFKKTINDLDEAIKKLKRNKFEVIINFPKYYKYKK